MADMQIREVHLSTRSLDETAGFYERLGCPVLAAHDSVRVTVGSTVLEFRTLERMTGALHLAFTIPTGSFDAVKEWSAANVTVLGTEDTDEFEGPPNWNSRSVYFAGPDQQLLEFIERRDLPAAADDQHADPTAAPTVVSVSEIGIAVPDVLGAVESLRRAGVEPYANAPGDAFAAVGDVDGLLILVSPDRRWFPTGDRVPSTAPMVIDIGLGASRELAEGVVLR